MRVNRSVIISNTCMHVCNNNKHETYAWLLTILIIFVNFVIFSMFFFDFFREYIFIYIYEVSLSICSIFEYILLYMTCN